LDTEDTGTVDTGTEDTGTEDTGTEDIVAIDGMAAFRRASGSNSGAGATPDAGMGATAGTGSTGDPGPIPDAGGAAGGACVGTGLTVGSSAYSGLGRAAGFGSGADSRVGPDSAGPAAGIGAGTGPERAGPASGIAGSRVGIASAGFGAGIAGVATDLGPRVRSGRYFSTLRSNAPRAPDSNSPSTRAFTTARWSGPSQSSNRSAATTSASPTGSPGTPTYNVHPSGWNGSTPSAAEPPAARITRPDGTTSATTSPPVDRYADGPHTTQPGGGGATDTTFWSPPRSGWHSTVAKPTCPVENTMSRPTRSAISASQACVATPAGGTTTNLSSARSASTSATERGTRAAPGDTSTDTPATPAEGVPEKDSSEHRIVSAFGAKRSTESVCISTPTG
jgi:hypothetical protein